MHVFLNLPWIEKIRRADRDNTIDIYISEDYDDVLADGICISKGEESV